MTTKVQALNTGAPDEAKRALGDIADDLAALNAQVTALVADIAAHRTTINAIITAATSDSATNIAAVTPAGAGSGAAAALSVTRT